MSVGEKKKKSCRWNLSESPETSKGAGKNKSCQKTIELPKKLCGRKNEERQKHHQNVWN